MEKPTCPGELRNPILIIDFTKNSHLSEQRNDFDSNAPHPGTSAVAFDMGPGIVPRSESPGCASLAEPNSLQHGLNLAANYLRKSIKPSTQDQVEALLTCLIFS